MGQTTSKQKAIKDGAGESTIKGGKPAHGDATEDTHLLGKSRGRGPGFMDRANGYGNVDGGDVQGQASDGHAADAGSNGAARTTYGT